MPLRKLLWIQIALGVFAASALILYGVAVTGASQESNPALWPLVGLFLLFIGWDIFLHLRVIKSSQSDRDHMD